MAVFRVERNTGYTVMSNHHLRNKELSLKAKGLLSQMLSLPEDWDYTTRGLASICKEGVDSVCATVRELEAAGYIIRRRIREIFRLSQGKMKQGYDCIVVARTRAAHADYWELKRAFEKTCKKLDLWETQA